MRMNNIFSLLRSSKLDITNEKRLQNEIMQLFEKYGVPIIKEYRLENGIIDFFLPDSSTGVEVKIKGRPVDILRQLQKYAEDDKIKVLVLVTSKSFAMPTNIIGKPLFVLNVARAWF